MNYDYAVIGGDERQSYLASILANKYKVIVFGVNPIPKGVVVGDSFGNTIKEAKCVLAPIPFTRDGDNLNCEGECYPLNSLFQTMTINQQLYAGAIPREWMLVGRRLQIHLTDYMSIEEIAWKNAVATAEGTLAEAIRHYPDNIQGARCVILGFGRCGVMIAKIFQSIGADVTVCVRREEVMFKGACLGYDMQSLEVLKQEKFISDSNINIMINTIPSRIIGEEMLAQMPKDCLVLDIAGQGVDWKKAEELGIEAYRCLGLPGMYAPRISAKILAEYIMKKGW